MILINCHNYINVYNPNQEDYNLDGVGDACDGVLLNEHNLEKKIVDIIDLLGRNVPMDSKYLILFFIYDDGTVERKYILK